MNLWRLLGVGYLLGIATAVVAYFAVDALRPTPSGDAQAAYSAIRTLRLALDARGDSLAALRAASAATAASADSTTTVNAEAVEISEIRADSIGAEIRARVDSAVAVMVAELEASHDAVVARLQASIAAERRARLVAQAHAALLELQVRDLEATIAEYERVDDIQSDRIRSLEMQRAGAGLLAIAGVACALFCG